MSAPNDTDRIIEAHRQEARKTRSLLIWLLVGIPAIAGFIWLIIWLIVVHAATSAPPTSAPSCDDQAEQGVVDLSTCPLNGPMLSSDSLCSAFNTAMNQPGDPSKTNPGEYFLGQNDVADIVQFDNDCMASPQSSLQTILIQDGIIQGDESSDESQVESVDPDPPLPSPEDLTTKMPCTDLMQQSDMSGALAALVGSQDKEPGLSLGTDLLLECDNHASDSGGETIGQALTQAKSDYAKGITPTPAG